MSMLIFASTRDRQEETHVNKFAFFVELQFSPIFTNFPQFSSISANSLKEQTIFTNSLKVSISSHHFSSLFITSRHLSANFRQFLAICINFGTPILADAGDGESQTVYLQSLRMLEMATNSLCALPNSNACGCWR